MTVNIHRAIHALIGVQDTVVRWSMRLGTKENAVARMNTVNCAQHLAMPGTGAKEQLV